MKVLTKEMKVPRMGEKDYDKVSVDERRAWLARQTGVAFEHIAAYSTPSTAMKGNIENLIGACQIPLGVVGPLSVNGEHAKGLFYVPMATTEGALVLDYQLGALMCTESGGVNVRIFRDFVHVDPAFYVDGLLEGQEFMRWLERHFASLKRIAESTTSHGQLLRIEPVMISRRVILKMVFDTKDAHGLNMINKASEKVCEHIKKELGLAYCLRSHHSSIKGVATNNYHEGQGKAVFADIVVSKETLALFFRVKPIDIEKYYTSSLYAAIQANRLGHTGHAANGLTAMFIACGQDVADISVSHVGVSTAEVNKRGDLYVSLYLPNLFLGTVGGGTALGTQKECLEMIGCYGKGKVKKFTEIVAAATIAGEISVLCALVNGNYVKAHEIYGRNRPAK
ncbi:MAG: hydroxymethylglutaryl-CoA reductase [Candidatus Omnitrophota bacterium]